MTISTSKADSETTGSRRNTKGGMARRDFLLRSACGLALYRLSLGLADDGAKARAAQQRFYWSWWGWEPLDHYRRTGGVVGAVDTKAPWLTQWYDRLHSEEIVRMMAGLGVNIGITHFFKGFGLVHERAEQQRVAGLVKSAHQHGIKILGYCQSRSLFHEQFLAEVPNAEDWIQRDEKGRLRTWGGAKFRWAPCIHCGEFRNYMKRTIRIGLEEIGLDGLHFDNNYCEPCYCQRCEQAFRSWMARRRPDCRDVKQPPTEKTPKRITDPVVQEWVRWRCESLAGYQGDLAAHARRIKPDVILLGNPAFPRDPNGAYKRSVWAPWIGRHLNLMFAENSNFPGIEDGTLISQVRASKYCTAIGYRVVSTVWKRNKLTDLGLPNTAEAIGLQIAEAAANDALPGTNWALRPLGEGNRMRVERPVLREALAKHLRFVRAQEPLWQHATPVQDVAVLHTFASTVFDNQTAMPLVTGAEEALIRGGFPWEVLFDDNLNRLAGFQVLVLAGQSHLADHQIEAIRTFVSRGGGLVAVGENGRYDEMGRERPKAAFSETVSLAKLTTTIEHLVGDRFSARLRGSDTVTLNAYELDKNRLAVHLVNYAANETPGGLFLELGGRWKTRRQARMLTTDNPECTVAVRPRIEIQPFKIYSVVVLE